MFYPYITKNFTSVVKGDFNFLREIATCSFPWLLGNIHLTAKQSALTQNFFATDRATATVDLAHTAFSFFTLQCYKP